MTRLSDLYLVKFTSPSKLPHSVANGVKDKKCFKTSFSNPLHEWITGSTTGLRRYCLSGGSSPHSTDTKTVVKWFCVCVVMVHHMQQNCWVFFLTDHFYYPEFILDTLCNVLFLSMQSTLHVFLYSAAWISRWEQSNHTQLQTNTTDRL